MAEPTATAQRAPLRRQPRASAHPTGGVAPESPEVPAADEVQAPTFGVEPEPELEAESITPPEELERPPSLAVIWQRLKSMEPKVEAMWLARLNAARRPAGKVTWACAIEDPPNSGLKCGNRIDSTPPGQPKDPPLICPKHGQSPHDLVE